MATLDDLYPPDTTDGDASPRQSLAPTLPPGSSVGTLYQPPPAEAPPPPPPKPILSTSFWKVPTSGAEGDAYGTGSVEMTKAGSEAVKNAAGMISGDTQVLKPEIGPLNLQDLGLGPKVSLPGGIDFGNVAALDPRAWAIAGQTALSRDPGGLARVIKERLPNATIDWDVKDAQGGPVQPTADKPGANLTVQVPGGPPMYLDRPGITPQKGLFYAGQAAAALMSAGRSLPAQMTFSGLQHALSTLGSWGLGGDQSPVDIPGTAIATAAPAVLGGVGAGLLKGYDWLNSEAATTAEAIADRARALARWGFAGKKGDITGDPGQLATEDLATNAGSDAAREHMRAFHDFNATTNDQNKRQIIGILANDTPPGQTVAPTYQPNESQFGDRLNQAVTNRVDQLTAVERARWNGIGPLSPDTAAGRAVTFSPDVSTSVLADGANTIREVYGAPQGPDGTWTDAQLGETGGSAVNAFNQLRMVMQPTAQDGTPGAIQGFNLGHLQDMRQQLNNVAQDNPGTSAAVAATRMRRALDGAVTTAETTPGQLAGDPQALADFRAANAATRARYAFTEPRDNPQAERFIAGVTNPAAPATGQQSINTALGAGNPITPGGGTAPIIMHLADHLGNGATEPLSGALGVRSLYGTRGTSAVDPTDPARFDYDSTAGRLGGQLAGQGSDVTDLLLPQGARDMLANYRQALNVLGTAGRKGAPRQNPSGTGYINTAINEIPWLGPAIEKLRSASTARNATQTGAEIMQRAVGGANTEAGLQIRLPRQSTLNAPGNPFFSWQPQAWRAGTPVYRGGGLLFGEQLPGSEQQNTLPSSQ